MKKHSRLYRLAAVFALAALAAASALGCARAEERQDRDGMEAAAVESPDIPIDGYEAWNELLSENEPSSEFKESFEAFAFESAEAVLPME